MIPTAISNHFLTHTCSKVDP